MTRVTLELLTSEEQKLAERIQNQRSEIGAIGMYPVITACCTAFISLLILAVALLLGPKDATLPTAAYGKATLLIVVSGISSWVFYFRQCQQRKMRELKTLTDSPLWPAVYKKLITLDRLEQNMRKQFYLADRLTQNYLLEAPIDRSL